MKRLLSFLLLFCATLPVFGQSPQSEDLFYRNGRIFVVFGVIGIIFIGILLFMIVLDMKIGRIEKVIKENSK